MSYQQFAEACASLLMHDNEAFIVMLEPATHVDRDVPRGSWQSEASRPTAPITPSTTTEAVNVPWAHVPRRSLDHPDLQKAEPTSRRTKTKG